MDLGEQATVLNQIASVVGSMDSANEHIAKIVYGHALDANFKDVLVSANAFYDYLLDILKQQEKKIIEMKKLITTDGGIQKNEKSLIPPPPSYVDETAQNELKKKEDHSFNPLVLESGLSPPSIKGWERDQNGQLPLLQERDI